MPLTKWQLCIHATLYSEQFMASRNWTRTDKVQGEVTSTVCVTLFPPHRLPLSNLLSSSLSRPDREEPACLCVCMSVLMGFYMFSIPEASARARSKRTHALCRSTYARFISPKINRSWFDFRCVPALARGWIWRRRERKNVSEMCVHVWLCAACCLGHINSLLLQLI